MAKVTSNSNQGCSKLRGLTQTDTTYTFVYKRSSELYLNLVTFCLSLPSPSLREEMEESFETFEEELWPPRAESAPQKPFRQIQRPGGEMHTYTRRWEPAQKSLSSL